MSHSQNARYGMKARATVSIIEQSPQVSSVLFRFLKKTRALRAGAAYPNVELALQKAPLNPPAVLLIDLDLAQRSVLAGLRLLKANLKRTKIVILTEDQELDRVFQAFRAGADGWFLKEEFAGQLAADVLELLGGGSLISAAAAKRLVFSFQTTGEPKAPRRRLSSREIEIVEQLARGLSDKEIAAALRIALTTVNDHLKSVYRKLHVHSRTEAVAKCLASSYEIHR